MIILHPVETFKDLLLEDLKEYPKEWLKFLFVETPIGWVLSGGVGLLIFMSVSTLLYWIG